MIITVVTYFDDKKLRLQRKRKRTEAYEEYLSRRERNSMLEPKNLRSQRGTTT